MTTSDSLKSPAPSIPSLPPVAATLAGIDWQGALKSALGSAVAAGVVTGGIYLIGKWIEDERARAVAQAAATRNDSTERRFDVSDLADLFADDDEPDEADAAAKLLGVDVDADTDAIRAALRARMSEARRHPDQGGDLETAQRLIAAKNLLIERVREKS